MVCRPTHDGHEAQPRNQDRIPDVRDGLTRIERTVLTVLREAQAELGERHVPVTLLYGRVVERVNVGQREFQAVLARLVGGGRGAG